MAFDDNPAATHNPATSTAPPASWGDILNANAVALGGATSFTPTWNSTGTAPAYGNATVNGVWQEIGDWMRVIFDITMGATSTYGTGTYSWTIPNSRSAAFTQMCGTGRALHNNLAINNTIMSPLASGTAITFELQGTASIAGQTLPFTWATSDVLRANLLIWCA